jgi:hypothetical protein
LILFVVLQYICGLSYSLFIPYLRNLNNRNNSYVDVFEIIKQWLSLIELNWIELNDSELIWFDLIWFDLNHQISGIQFNFLSSSFYFNIQRKWRVELNWSKWCEFTDSDQNALKTDILLFQSLIGFTRSKSKSCHPMEWNAMECNVMQCDAMWCNVMQCDAKE